MLVVVDYLMSIPHRVAQQRYLQKQKGSVTGALHPELNGIQLQPILEKRFSK
jgi:hypothetical protein